MKTYRQHSFELAGSEWVSPITFPGNLRANDKQRTMGQVIRKILRIFENLAEKSTRFFDFMEGKGFGQRLSQDQSKRITERDGQF